MLALGVCRRALAASRATLAGWQLVGAELPTGTPLGDWPPD
ncbi:hypothetical protein [Streptomyces blattellae]|nr:hypothetical protein [Streptomyces blattellae]